jgi:acetate---CoA ligase (ADP-forming)
VRRRERLRPPEPSEVDLQGVQSVETQDGPLLSFGDTMRLLRGAGVPVLPYALVQAPSKAREAAAPLGPKLVAKLANVLHRTEHDAVRLNVSPDGVEAAVRDLQLLAARENLPGEVVIQSMLPSAVEAFIGVDTRSPFGPLVVFGLGGILVELIRDFSARTAPLSELDALDMLDELRVSRALDGFRNLPAWNRVELARLLVSVGNLAAGGRAWLSSLDINPLLPQGNRFFVADASCIIKPLAG